MSNNGNGHNEIDIDDLENLDDITSGKVPNIDSFEDTFSQPHSSDNIRHILTPGKNLVELGMKSQIKNMRVAYCIATDMAKCLKHNSSSGKQFNLMILSLGNGVRGAQVKLAGDCIVGERHNTESRNFGGKMKQFLGMDQE